MLQSHWLNLEREEDGSIKASKNADYIEALRNGNQELLAN